jgi:hypothetical protein
MTNEQNDVISETDNLIIWRSKEDIGYLYHLELGTISLHLLPEEWEEIVILISQVNKN